jgi:DNA-binding NarL/FixJ family response regulator
MNLVIVDDHDIFRQSLALLLNHKGGHQVVGTFSSAESLLVWNGAAPDLILLDYHIPQQNAWQALEQLQQRWPTVSVVFLTGTGSAAVLRQIVASSAAGVLHKRDSAETILELLAKIDQGQKVVSPEIAQQIDEVECGFTARELEVLSCLLQGRTAEEIADSLHISRRTVEKHKENMMRKAELHNLAQLIELGHRLELH